MLKEKHSSTKRKNSKLIILFLAVTLIVGSVIGSTVAWLIANTKPVVNTFTYGDIDITLEETGASLDESGDFLANEYKMIPGQNITKDPIITVESGSEEMWLFVKLEESSNFSTFMEYTIDGSWAKLDSVTNVYYRHITAAEIANENLEVPVLENNTVFVKATVTKEMLNELDANGNEDYPTLTVTAYAVQYAGNATAVEAWEKTTPTPTDTP